MLLAIDVGKGTEDILLWDKKSKFENAIQLVLPSNTQLVYKKLEKFSQHPGKIFIIGELMGGEPWHKLVYTICQKTKQRVVMDTTSALSLRYNLEHVRLKGVKIISPLEMDKLRKPTQTIHLSDVNWQRLFGIMKQSKIPIESISKILLCCQEHGRPTRLEQNTRDFRMGKLYEKLLPSCKLESLLLRADSIPQYFPRFQSITQSALKHFLHLSSNDVFVLDSSAAVTLGAIEKLPYQLIVNAGNGHTIITFLKNSQIQLIYETHTGNFSLAKFKGDISRLLTGTLTHQLSLKEGGHGVFQISKLDIKEKYMPYTLIGPQRGKFFSPDAVYAHPGGNTMMAGPIGLIRAYKKICLEVKP